MRPLTVVDVGNTRIKAGLVDGSDRVAAVRTIDPARPGLEGLVAILSVSRPRTEALLAGLGAGVEARVLGRDLPLLVESRVRRSEQVGHDRLANAVAAHVLADGAAVVADVGTAITVDAVDASGAFLGGTIAPGPRVALEGLRARAPHLPDPGADAVPGPLGGTTVEAMAAALAIGFAGLLDRLLDEVAAAAGGSAPRFLTGGGADAIRPRLRSDVRVVPDLTLEGIRILTRRAGL